MDDSANPVWNEELALTSLSGLNSVLRVEVYDFDEGEEDQFIPFCRH